jgi:cation transport ATPase
METITLGTLIAVFEEMFGRALFWALVAVAVTITLGWLYVLIRDRRVSRRKFLLAQLAMPVGAVAAVWFVLAITHSGLRHIGGPIDWIVLLGIAAAVAAGLAMLVYVVQSLLRPPRPPGGMTQGLDKSEYFCQPKGAGRRVRPLPQVGP